MSSRGIELFFDTDYDKAKAKLLGLVPASFGSGAQAAPKTAWKRAAAAALKTGAKPSMSWNSMAKNMKKSTQPRSAASSINDAAKARMDKFWHNPTLPGMNLRELAEVAPHRPYTPAKKVRKYVQTLEEHAPASSSTGPGAMGALAVAAPSGGGGGSSDRKKAARVAKRFRNKKWHDILLMPNPAPDRETKAKPARIEIMDPENNKDYNSRALRVLLDDEVSKAQAVANDMRRLRELSTHSGFLAAAKRVGVDVQSLWPRDVHTFGSNSKGVARGVRIVSMQDQVDEARWTEFLEWEVNRIKRLALVLVEARKVVRLQGHLLRLANERAHEAMMQSRLAAEFGDGGGGAVSAGNGVVPFGGGSGATSSGTGGALPLGHAALGRIAGVRDEAWASFDGGERDEEEPVSTAVMEARILASLRKSSQFSRLPAAAPSAPAAPIAPAEPERCPPPPPPGHPKAGRKASDPFHTVDDSLGQLLEAKDEEECGETKSEYGGASDSGSSYHEARRPFGGAAHFQSPGHGSSAREPDEAPEMLPEGIGSPSRLDALHRGSRASRASNHTGSARSSSSSVVKMPPAPPPRRPRESKPSLSAASPPSTSTASRIAKLSEPDAAPGGQERVPLSTDHPRRPAESEAPSPARRPPAPASRAAPKPSAPAAVPTLKLREDFLTRFSAPEPSPPPHDEPIAARPGLVSIGARLGPSTSTAPRMSPPRTGALEGRLGTPPRPTSRSRMRHALGSAGLRTLSPAAVAAAQGFSPEEQPHSSRERSPPVKVWHDPGRAPPTRPSGLQSIGGSLKSMPSSALARSGLYSVRGGVGSAGTGAGLVMAPGFGLSRESARRMPHASPLRVLSNRRR